MVGNRRGDRFRRAQPMPAPSLIAGGAHVEIREWVVPTPGSRPHDPLAYPDGSIWYTGHMANVLGRVDPRSGKITEYHPDIPSSGPHGLVADQDGNIWFTGNFAGYIGRFDPTHRQLHRLQAARSGRARSAHADLRPARHAVVHRAGCQHGRPARSEDRRDQAGELADAAIQPVRHGGQFARHPVVLRIRRRTSWPVSTPRRWRSTNTRCRTPRAGRAVSP